MDCGLIKSWSERGNGVLTSLDITRRGNVEMSINETVSYLGLTEAAAVEGVCLEGLRFQNFDDYVSQRLRSHSLLPPFPPGFTFFVSSSPSFRFRRSVQTGLVEATRQTKSKIVTRTTETNIAIVGDWDNTVTPDGEIQFSHEHDVSEFPISLTITFPISFDNSDGVEGDWKRYTRAICVRRNLFGPEGVTGGGDTSITLEGGELGQHNTDNVSIDIPHPSIVAVLFASWLTEDNLGLQQSPILTHQECQLKVYI